MAGITTKQQEIKNREIRILQIARRTILDEGYHGLSMDRVAEEVRVSKGTIYNHFGCKEEIIIALAVETMEKRVELFQAAAQFHGNSRERLLAVERANNFFFAQFPDYFRFEQMLRIDSIWEKTSEKRRGLIRVCEMRCMTVVAGIVRDAIATEALDLPDGMTPEDLVFGLWSISLGAQTIISSSESLIELGVNEPDATLGFHVRCLLDAYRWKPLSSDFDYLEVESRIDREVLGQS